MGINTVAVTGGSGTIGSEIVDVLSDRGYHVINLDQRESEDGDADDFVRVDLLDAGETYGAVAKWDADAVIHMGTIPNPTSTPGYVTYESNVMSSYIVLEVATELDLEAVCLASSINAHGWTFQDEPPEIEYLPIDERHPVSPRDPYGLSKHVIEVTADGFGRRADAPERIATLRFTGVVDDEGLRRLAERNVSLEDLRDEYDRGDNPAFRYLHVRDAATLAAETIDADYTGHERFWAVAPDSSVEVPTEQLIEEFYPDTEIRKPLSGADGLFDVSKAREMVGWNPRFSWRG